MMTGGLIVCEKSQAVTIAFRKRGIKMYSCDTQPCSGEYPKWHIQDDLFTAIKKFKRLFFLGAHPPCTFLANSGSQFLYNPNGSINEDRWNDMCKAAVFFNRILKEIDKAGIGYIENPIIHRHARKRINSMHTQIIQPWQHGHGETKATCLWLHNLPLLRPSFIMLGREQRIRNLPPSKNRSELRSITYPGIAEAMANQWSYKIKSIIK